MGLLHTLSTGAPPSFSGNVNGDIYSVNGIDRPWVRDHKNGIRNWGIEAPPAAPGLAAGAAGNPNGTLKYKVTWENQNADIYGLYSAEASITVTSDQVTITRPSIAGIDPQVTHWVWWRTKDGEADVFYRGDSTAIGTNTDTDNYSDDTIGENEILVEHSPPDGMFRYVREFKGDLVLYGSRVESTGTVTVANGSGNVTGIGTQFNESHEGEKFYFTGDATVYTISSVAAASGAAALVITPVKSGAVTGGTYKIVAERASDMTVQRADDESFEAAERWSVFPNDGDFPSGMEIVGNTLCLFKERHIYGYERGLEPNPIDASAVCYPILTNRGLINEWCIVNVGPTAYLLDRVGIYQFDGAGQAVPIDQAIRRLFQPDPGIPTEERINWAYASTWRATFDPVMNAAKWAVTTGTETSPETILCFDLESQQWTMDKDPAGIRSFAVDSDTTGLLRAWKTPNRATVAGPWAMGGTQQLDGTTTGTISGTSTASGNTSLTDGAAAFTTAGDGLAGIPVVALTNPYQIRMIDSNTGTVLTISPAWTTNPPNGTKYRVGAVETRWKSAWLLFDAQSRQNADVLTLFFEPTSSDLIFYVRLFKDFQTTPILGWDPRGEQNGVEIPYGAKTDGWIRIHANEAAGRAVIVMPQNAERAFAVECLQLDCNNPIIVTGYDLEINQKGRSNRAE